MAKSISTINDLPMTLISTWRENPSLAARDLLYDPLSENEADRFTLIPIQRVVINRIWRARNSIVVGCRGFGKTYTAATMGILKALLYPGRRVGTLSASFRQSKQIFEEITNIWNRSPILQACTERSPIISNDSCRLTFKTVTGHNSSVIIALPLADGQRIRGSRMHTLLLDEANIIPRDTFDTVLRPFAATAQEPVKQMMLRKKIKEIENSELNSNKKVELVSLLKGTSSTNEILMFLSGYYSYNWVYSLYYKYSNRMHGIKNTNDDLGDGYTDTPSHFATFQVPYWSLPEDFLSEEGLINARRDMNSLQFRMEYEAAWISDSGGFFSIQEIDACKAENRGMKDFCMHSSGDPAKQYIMTIDPARTRDAFAIILSEIDPSVGLKIAHIEQHFKAPTPKMVQRIFTLLATFNVTAIGMDRGGGGQTVADFLAQGTAEYSPIFDREDESYRGRSGRHILKLVDFGTNWIEGANHNAKLLIERQQVVFPAKSLDGASTDKKLDEMDRYSQIIEQLIMQLISIQVSETRTGRAHFDLPSSGGGFVQHKDLYSAFLIACDMYFNMIQSNYKGGKKLSLLGIVTPRGSYAGGW